MRWRALWCIPGVTGRTPWADILVQAGWRVQRHARHGLCRVLDPQDRCRLRGDEAACRALLLENAPAVAGRTALILLHGLGRTRHTMAGFAEAAEQRGWTAAALTYPSLTRPYPEHVATTRQVVAGLRAAGITNLHFIGHSMGGLIARAVMAEEGLSGRAVLIGTPNQGAELAEILTRFAPYRGVMGPCGQTVRPEPCRAIPLPERSELAVIAGGNCRSGYNPFLSGDNDGIVTVAETRLGEREADFLQVDALHTTLPLRGDVIAASLSFLETGRLTAQAPLSRPAAS